MDLNYLYSRHQISLINARAAQCTESRLSHLGLAKLYAAKINSVREKMEPAQHGFALRS
jgi:3-deoxy-D-manno-octulosonate 8-phosphate phosphatase KdsC-like HAD superfamily phosphatase